MNHRFDPSMDRARDVMHLEWLALTDRGVTSYQIGKRYSVKPEHVRTVLLRIKADTDRSEQQ